MLTVRTYEGPGHPLTVTHYVIGDVCPRVLQATSHAAPEATPVAPRPLKAA